MTYFLSYPWKWHTHGYVRNGKRQTMRKYLSYTIEDYGKLLKQNAQKSTVSCWKIVIIMMALCLKYGRTRCFWELTHSECAYIHDLESIC